MNPNAKVFNPFASEFVPGDFTAKCTLKDSTTLATDINKKDSASAVQSDAIPDNASTGESATIEEPVVLNTNKEHVNIVFCGHVDAGKSTIGGHILVLTGLVDKRTLEKYEKESKEAGRESWYLSWALDTSTEERAKGITVECGKAYFETPKKRFTILDAPGHKNYVPSMITGASQADIAVLVISARRGEFETGFDKGGQTREHAKLIKTQGVKRLIVAINKMDEPTVNWSKERYDEIIEKFSPFLKNLGFNLKTEVFFIPISGFTGANLKDRLPVGVFPCYDGPSLLEYLDNIPPIPRNVQGGFLMPIMAKSKDMGFTFIEGKIESGVIRRGASIAIMPNRNICEIVGVSGHADEIEIAAAGPGENVRLKLRGIEEEDINLGWVACDVNKPVKVAHSFEAIVSIQESKNIVTTGYSAVMHVHAAVVEVDLAKIINYIDPKTGKPPVGKPSPLFLKKNETALVKMQVKGAVVCMEPYSKHPQLGRFTLRDEGKTVAIGRVTKVYGADGVAELTD